MGNSVGIFVVLDHEQVREDPDPQNAGGTAVFAHQAGEPLTGKVQIEVKKRTKGDQVKLFLAGKEKIYTKHKNRRVTDVRNVIQIGADLADMRNRWVKKGNYSFPFSLDMPETLPSSMSYGDARKSACRVQYEISAGMGKAKIERFFRVASAPFQDIKVPCFIEPKTERIKSLGFLDVGTVTFGASVNDTQVGRGNEIDVAIACRNNSTVDIRSVEFKLVELVSYSSHDESFERKISLKEMKHIHMPGLITTKVTRDDVLISQSSRGQNDINEQIFEALLSEHNVVKVKIPTWARDSYAGAIVKVSHYIKIKLMTGAFVENASVKIPIHIGNPPRSPSSGRDYQGVLSHEQPRPQANPVSVILPIDEIPLVSAVPIPVPLPPPDAIESSQTVYANAVVLGGTAVQRQYAEPDIEFPGIGRVPIDLSGLVPVPLPGSYSSTPSLSSLLREMAMSVNDFSIIESKLSHPEWKQVFAALHPEDVGEILGQVRNHFDQPRVALSVAKNVRLFTCAHCVEALRRTADWNRTTMVTNLAQLCVDLRPNHRVIEAELTAWERTVTLGAIQKALKEAR